MTFVAGTFKFSQEPFIKVKADSLNRHPFMPVTLRHCWDESIAMSAEVMLDTGNAATGITGIYLPQYQVQKLQLRPLGGTKEVECWGGGTTRLQQYEPIWVSARVPDGIDPRLTSNSAAAKGQPALCQLAKACSFLGCYLTELVVCDAKICTIDLVAPLISQDLARLSPYHCCCHCLRCCPI